MPYNSNGYIMLDFSMLDFSRTNQVIEGIYQRVFEIVGANKFVLILNAQSKTPLPACVSFVNSSYVIESFLYNFAITLDDNVRIENVSTDIIKDGIISAGTTWSSQKINEALSNIPSEEIEDITDDIVLAAECLVRPATTVKCIKKGKIIILTFNYLYRQTTSAQPNTVLCDINDVVFDGKFCSNFYLSTSYNNGTRVHTKSDSSTVLIDYFPTNDYIGGELIALIK